MQVTFSPVNKPEEIKETADLAAEIWNEYYISLLTQGQIDYMIEKFQSVPAITSQIEHQGYEYYLIRNEEAAVGYVAVKEDEGRLFLSKFYVKREDRGRGYASQANAFLEQLCRERRLSHIWLTVNRDNRSSIAVYEKKGFRTIREQIADIGNGYVMDDFVMEKEMI
ncbi:GNAT family N-acetyltransferase [Saccharibacillus kuerlensis]|uniref:N-acetyltransferase n=1 Tax=Saccharibacillus kuerlensis TaxID=459527 RepID=A0ABQ2LB43_9BACL|nr:GNAT family N-acetyltransferase [Saccharibacillus kuerlensis]GGO08938.1 N-acetyltransferase [Saccharibacillus kuerlensis]